MSRYKQPYSLYKRGKYFYYRTYTPDGVRTVPKSTGCTSKGAARAYCDKLYLEGSLWSSGETFGVFAAGFFDDDGIYFRDRMEPAAYTTRRTYQSNFRKNVFSYFENIKLNDINYVMLKTYRLYLIDCEFSAASISLYMKLLKYVIDFAFRSRLIPVNPFLYLEPLSIKRNIADAFTLEEVKYIYQNIDIEFKNTILFIALTGLRISEYIGLTADDIKNENGVYYIDLRRQFLNNEYIPLKNKKPRVVPLAPELVSLVGFDPSRRVYFYKAIEPLKSKYETADRLLRVHSLRHFFITRSKSDGVPDIKIEIIAGHSLEGIKNVYTNFKLPDLVEVIPWQQKMFNIIVNS